MEEQLRRKSYISVGDIFFWTATINGWKHLIKDDEYKDIIINSFDFLSKKGLLDIFSFVIMPNHIHFIWRTNSLNGKETVQGSFLKFTAHEFRKKLQKEDPDFLDMFAVVKQNKKHEFWQRDSLAVHLTSKIIAYQKLDYIHNNPLAEHWSLVKDPNDYTYSSCSFYEKGEKRFEFLKDLRNEF